MKIERILICGQEQPAAVDRESLQFSWELASGQENCMQSAYQIRVIEERSGLVMWDTGHVQSSKSTGVIYEGSALKPAQRYRLDLCVWDECSHACEPSHTWFGTGLSPHEWQAKDIWKPQEHPNSYVLFRKSFSLSAPAEQATVYLFAHNDAVLLINGVHIAAGPARSDPYSYGQYLAIDVSSHLKKGINSLQVLAHWHGMWKDSGVNAHPCLRMELHIHSADGTFGLIKTDETWQWHTTPYIEENPVWFGFYGGEKNRASILYDARQLVDSDMLSEAGWQPVVCVDRSFYQLYAQRTGIEQERLAVRPVSIRQQSDHAWLVEFPYCLTGWPQIAFSGCTCGERIQIQYWEVQPGWGDAGYDTYICSGANDQFYTPFVRHTSFRYLEIRGFSGILNPEHVIGWLSSSEEERNGIFSCSDERMNQIYEMCTRSSWQNVQQGIISVDANREQSPWTADSWNIGMGILYNHRNTQLIDKIIRDYAAEQLPNGNLLSCSPARDFHSELAEWSLYWPMLLWEQYMASADLLLLKHMYPILQRLLKYFETTRKPSGLYDPPGWRASDYAGGSISNGGENIVTNCHLYMVYRLSEKIAARLGADDRPHHAQKAASLYEAINRLLLRNGCCYKTCPNSSEIHPLGTAWALRAGVVPKQHQPGCIRWLAEMAQRGIDVGGYGGDALFSALYTAGLGELAVQNYTRYDQMLKANYTNWESFGELSPDNMGNHAWTAYPAYLMPRYVGGIRSLKPGYEAVEIRPVTGGLSYSHCSIPTVRGDVTSSWNIDANGIFCLTVTIPANMTAYVYLPGQNEPRLVQSGVHSFTCSPGPS